MRYGGAVKAASTTVAYACYVGLGIERADHFSRYCGKVLWRRIAVIEEHRDPLKSSVIGLLLVIALIAKEIVLTSRRESLKLNAPLQGMGVKTKVDEDIWGVVNLGSKRGDASDYPYRHPRTSSRKVVEKYD